MSGLMSAAIARIEDFLLEPAEPGVTGAEQGARAGAAPPEPLGPRPVIAVFGLARRCGSTMVARALASELAARDPGGACAVASVSSSGALPLATPAARRLAETLADVPGASTKAVGRLCLVDGAEPVALADCARQLAPLVLDRGSTAIGGEEAGADRLLLVTAPTVEKALAAVAVSCLRRTGAEPLVVTNLVRAASAPEAAAAADEAPGGAELPYSRAGAQLALGGRQARGELGRAVAALADICELPG